MINDIHKFINYNLFQLRVTPSVVADLIVTLSIIITNFYDIRVIRYLKRIGVCYHLFVVRNGDKEILL